MRFIDTSHIVPANNWTDLATQANFNPVWSYFKSQFEAIAKKKCWYSESDNTGAINPIDHFRPKGATIKKLTKKNADLDDYVWSQIDADSRNGYSFLEFEFANYRHACGIVNSITKGDLNKAKGKSNYFPLKSLSSHGSDLTNIHLEEVCLLDPCKKSDVNLLFFNSSGNVEPHFSVKDQTWDFCRVKVSVEVYHLHYYLFVEKRIEQWNFCKMTIELIDFLYANTSMEAKIKVAQQIAELKKRTDVKHQFSAVAIDCIKHFKKNGGLVWLDHFFPDASLEK